MKQRSLFFFTISGLVGIAVNAYGDSRSLPPPPPPPPYLTAQKFIAENENVNSKTIDSQKPSLNEAASPEYIIEEETLPIPVLSPENSEQQNFEQIPSDNIPHGQNLVSIDFPNGVNLTDIIKTVGVWAGKNFVIGQGVANNAKISIIAPEPMTKEEAYQAFLSALNISGFTTVETGQIVKILSIPTAKSTNIKTYYGSSWAPETDEIINQVIPLKFIDANTVLNQLRPLLALTQSVAFTTTNSLILTDTGFRIKSLLEIIQLLDNRKDQPQVEIVPINHMDAKEANQKITEIFGSKSGSSISLQKSLVDERTNSLILIGPARGLDDVVKFIKRFDAPMDSTTGQSMIHVRPLDYADSEKLAQTLQAFSQNQSSRNQSPYFPPRYPQYGNNTQRKEEEPSVADLSGVKIASDKSTNSLIIQGSQNAYLEIEKLIQSLDQRRSQIYLEADILDLSLENGLSWQPSVLGGATVDGKFVTPFGFNPTNASVFNIPQNGSSQDFQQSLAGIGSNLLLGILSNTTVDLGGFKVRPGALLFALKTDANTNVLQTPSMMVSDNETAKFNATAQYRTILYVPNPNGTGTVPSPQTYDVTTALNVTPQISRSNYVNLKINLQLDDAGAANPTTGYPNPIQKRSAESVVTVRSGQTAVMGGLTKESHKKSEAKIPLLGDIPILGWLFKIVQDEKIKSNLTLFLTPHVVKNSQDLEKIYKDKIRDRDEFLRMYYGKHYKNEDFYRILPTEDAGNAIPEKEMPSYVEAQNKKMKPREQKLPSQNHDPITAPTATASNGSRFNSVPRAPTQTNGSRARRRSNTAPPLPQTTVTPQ